MLILIKKVIKSRIMPPWFETRGSGVQISLLRPLPDTAYIILRNSYDSSQSFVCYFHAVFSQKLPEYDPQKIFFLTSVLRGEI